mmetsp:Transcript_34297/g.78220  ORF Transcript_34297/g.78220 Transcript_34297/m.78220 type:complete len:110 (-) Transcript_34297:695-1024(-)
MIGATTTASTRRTSGCAALAAGTAAPAAAVAEQQQQLEEEEEEEDDDDDGALLYDVALVFAIRPGKIPESPRPRVVSFARMEILVWGGSSSRLQNDSFGELSWDLRELW